MRTLGFTTVLLLGLATVPSGAHLLELPNKLRLSAASYFTVQNIYRGWALLGILVVAALISSVTLTLRLRPRRAGFVPALVASLCVFATQIVFWAFTFPVNQRTANWTILPSDWQQLRLQWEFSHAASALLNIAAFAAAIVAVMNAARAETPVAT